MDLHKELLNDSRFRQAFSGMTLYGVAGTNGSGKDSVMQVLSECGFFVFNTGDALRQITKAVMGTTQRGGNDSPTGRIGNAQRAVYPGGMVSLGMIDYWARILHMDKDLQPAGLVIGSVRSVSEAGTLHDFGGKLIAVDAEPKVRYERIVARARTYEKSITFEQFMAEDEAEMGRGETDPTKFGTAQLIDMADITLQNNGNDIEVFMSQVKQTLGLHG